MEDKEGTQQLCVFVSLCVCVSVCMCVWDGERGGDGWTDSMMEQCEKKCFFLYWVDF